MDKKERMKLLSYFIMGDGGVYRRDNGNAQFIMNMKSEHEDYMGELINLIDFTTVNKYSRKDYNTDGCIRQPQFRLESRRHPVFTQFWERIYTGKYKGLDPMYIKQLDWHTLAILFQADGSLKKDFRPKNGMVNPSFDITLNLKRLSYGDLEMLGKYLTKNLGVFWTINRQNQYYYIRIKSKSNSVFVKGIAPYIHESFKYKIRTFDPSL